MYIYFYLIFIYIFVFYTLICMYIYYKIKLKSGAPGCSLTTSTQSSAPKLHKARGFSELPRAERCLLLRGLRVKGFRVWACFS